VYLIASKLVLPSAYPAVSWLFNVLIVCGQYLVSEPDPRKIRKENLV